MTPSQIEAARALVASPHFRWMPGMRTLTGLLVARVDARGVALTTAGFALTAGDLPDLTDPATLGCLLALAREAWDDRGLACQGEYHHSGWLWAVYGGKPHGGFFLRNVEEEKYPTEGEALVAAILKAPSKVTP